MRCIWTAIAIVIAGGCGQLELLEGHVFDEVTGEPISQASVTVVELQVSTTTDEEGYFAMEVADGSYELVASADGYLFRRERGVASPGGVDMELAAEPTRTDGSTATSSLPATIRVWRRSSTPGCATFQDCSCWQGARVDLLPFETYVKGVLPSEWYSTSPMEALKAGAIAVRSFATNWVLSGGRWGCADVDDGTVTQAYGSVSPQPWSNLAVDQTRGQVLMQSGRVYRSEYSKEHGLVNQEGVVDDVCNGFGRIGHGRGMCQDGSIRWAEHQAKHHTWILDHYYPGKNVVTLSGADSGGTIGSCDHSIYQTGGPLSPECHPCAAVLCQSDRGCCERAWDNTCVLEVQQPSVLSYCTPQAAPVGGQCHDVCQAGGYMLPDCGWCATRICETGANGHPPDTTCCGSNWDETCVNAVSLFCGYSCQ